jgi:folate-dependent phosphoribosylglycinamide formyltransferase PurN
MRAMMQQEDHVVMTMHVIDTGIDTGRVLGEAAVPVDPSSSLFAHRIRLHVGGKP